MSNTPAHHQDLTAAGAGPVILQVRGPILSLIIYDDAAGMIEYLLHPM